MADFCRHCAIEHGFPETDLADITPQEMWEQNRAAVVTCEGCGNIQVNPLGECVSEDCLEQGKPGHGLPWFNAEDQRSKSPGAP